MEEYTRKIRSFALRAGRMSRLQKEAMERLYPRFGLEYDPDVRISFKDVFGNDHPVVLEIGFGMGHATAEIAGKNPEMNYLAAEVHTPGVGKLLSMIEEKGLTNIRIIKHDVVEVLEHMVEDQVFSGVHIFFPDPWPKKKHHKRRLVQDSFVKLILPKLKPDGYIYTATDWEEYADQMLDVFSREAELKNSTVGFAQDCPYRPVTRFEQKGLDKQYKIRECLFFKQ